MKENFISLGFHTFVIHANFMDFLFKLLVLNLTPFDIVANCDVEENFFNVHEDKMVIINGIISQFKVHKSINKVVNCSGAQ